MPGLFFETMDRANMGRRVHEEDFDTAIMPRALALAKKYDIPKFDPAHIVTADDALADRLFAAAMEFAVETGLWVLDTQKVMKFSEAEIWERLDNLHTPLWFGYGKDQVCLMPRKPEGTERALVIGGAAGSSVTEGEVYTKLMMAFALEPTNDMVTNGNPASIEGREVRPFSPLETHGAIQEVTWIREATRRAGRPGMPLFVAPGTSATAPPAIAVINEERGLRKGDFIYAALLTEMKTDYDRLSRAVAGVENGLHIAALLAPMIGGWAGPPEGAAIVGTAACLMAAVAYDATLVVFHPVHMSLKNGATTHPQTLWIESLGGQAIARNTRFPLGQNVFLDARAGTDEILYEAAANALVAVSSGQHTGPGPSGVTGGDDIDMISAVEMRLLGETTRAATGMSRKQANEIVLRCLEKYQPTLGKPPKGKRFQELYDLARLKPTDEWWGKYEKVKGQLKEWGVPFR
jgi:methylamine---corrinoid protein Co-methyltransferase